MFSMSVLHRFISLHGISILSKSMPRSFIKSPKAMIFSRVVITLKARVSNSGWAGEKVSLGCPTGEDGMPDP